MAGNLNEKAPMSVKLNRLIVSVKNVSGSVGVSSERGDEDA